VDTKEKFEKFLKRHPHPHHLISEKPHLTRRHLFQLAGTGLTMGWLAGELRADGPVITENPVTTINKAKNVVFILLTGAPSHTDTFDYKATPDKPADLLKPATKNGLLWPSGILPKLGEQLGDVAIIRSARSWALVHGLSQTWYQIGRNPAAALGDIAPNLGSIVAVEKEADRRPGQIFPSFLALNAPSGIGSGYLPSAYAPFRVGPAPSGIRNTVNRDDPTGAGVMSDRTQLLDTLDGSLRSAAPYGQDLADMDAFYKAARGMMYNPAVTSAFTFTSDESAQYGASNFGNACLVARKVLAANQGTRFIQISFGSWDHHQNIYADANLPRMSKMLDDGVSQLLAELKASGLLDETLVVMMGEFGRTVGPLTAAAGRDHWMQQSVMFAGAGVKGGRVIGATTADGREVADPGWSRKREVRPEDIEATIYSALGINWTRVRYDDPFGRGFYYVPSSDADLYGPVNELWA
jgi:hypothetical protein